MASGTRLAVSSTSSVEGAYDGVLLGWYYPLVSANRLAGSGMGSQAMVELCPCFVVGVRVFASTVRGVELEGGRSLSFSSSMAGSSQDPGMVVVVRTPKTRRIWHRQFVLCNDGRLERWLAWWVQGCGAGTKLFPLSRYLWNKYFSAALQYLHVMNCGFTLGSLRAGGATNHFRRFQNLGMLQFLGRWTSSNTLQFYLQEAFSTHVQAHFSSDTMKKLEVLHRFVSLLEAPPTSPLRRASLGWVTHSCGPLPTFERL